MGFQKNETKERFRILFSKEVEKLERGSFLKDEDIQKFLSANKFEVSISSAMSFIRQMELEIGLTLKKRLKRIKNEGYLVLEPRVQVDTALREGKLKVEIALKRTAHRLEAVEVSSFTPEQQRELLSRTAAIDSLLSIVKNSSITRKAVNRREVELLSHTAIQSKQLKKHKE